MEWSKVGQTELPDRAQVHGGTLTIYDVQPGDEGQYRCTATTDRSIAADDARLKVQEARRSF